MAGVDDDDTFDGEDPDIMAAFLQLQHSHKMLLREKEEVERCKLTLLAGAERRRGGAWGARGGAAAMA